VTETRIKDIEDLDSSIKAFMAGPGALLESFDLIRVKFISFCNLGTRVNTISYCLFPRRQL